MDSKVPLVSEPRLVKVVNDVRTIHENCRSGKMKKAEADLKRLLPANTRPESDPVVWSRILAVTHSYFHDKFIELREAIACDERLYSPNVVLSAISFTLDDGDTNTAQRMLQSIDRIENVCRHAYISGRLSQLLGNNEEARMHYMTAFRADPYFIPIYDGLSAVDPSFGWTHVKEIMSLKTGSDPTLSDSLEGKMAELSAMYSEWVRGDRSNALCAIDSSSAMEEGDPFYKLVYAWMCVSDGHYRKAVRSYLEAIRGFGGNVAFLIEMADIQDRMGESEDSAIACRRALEIDRFSDSALAQLAIAQVHMGKIRDAMATMELLSKLPITNASVCARCIDVLWEEGRSTDANMMFKKISGRCSDIAYASYLSAKNHNRNGKYQSAKKYAEEGLREDEDNILCVCQYAVALAGMGRVDQALDTLGSKRPVFMDDMRLLDTEKDILIGAGMYDRAIDVCDIILDSEPRNADVMRDKANALRLKGDYAQAVSCYRESLNIREDIRLFISVLKMLLESRRIDDLCRLTDDFDDTYGISATVWRIRGNAEYAAERYEDAVLSFSKASSIVTNDIDIWHSRGMAEEKAGLFADAEASYDRAVILDLEDADCWISKAVVQEVQGNYKGAIDSLNRVISFSSDNVYALAMKGRILARLGMFKEARYFLTTAFKLDADVRLLEMILRIYVRENDTEQAIRIGKAVLSKDRNNYEVMLLLAGVYAIVSDRDSALKLLNDARPLVADKREPSLRCAAAYHGLMCYAEEISIYLGLLDSVPDDQDVLMRLAEAYMASGDRDSASEIYRKLEEMDPENMDVSVKKVMASSDAEVPAETPDSASMFEFAKTLADSGKTGEAIELLLKAVESCPEDPEQYLYTAEMLSVNGRYEEGLDVMKKARGAFPSDARVMFFLGEMKSRRGDNAGALSAYNDAARLGMSNFHLLYQMGKTQLDMGMLSPAVESLASAVSADPSNIDARVMLSNALFRSERQEEALPHLLYAIQNGAGAEPLRMYVSEYHRERDTEAILSVYSYIQSEELSDSDRAYFRDVLKDIGEYTKAEEIASKEPTDGFDAEKAAAEVLDVAYTNGYGISDPELYECLGLSEEQKDAVLDLFTSPIEYVPDFDSDEFSLMEMYSRSVLISGDVKPIECGMCEVPLPTIRHATGSGSISSIRSVQMHIRLASEYSGVEESLRGRAESICAEMSAGSEMTAVDIMEKFSVGPFVAKTVLNILRE